MPGDTYWPNLIKAANFEMAYTETKALYAQLKFEIITLLLLSTINVTARTVMIATCGFYQKIELTQVFHGYLNY